MNNTRKRFHIQQSRAKGFEPRPYYGHEEDCLTFYFHNAESYAKRVDELLTLFLSLKTNELVGCQVKGPSLPKSRPNAENTSN